MYWQVLVYGKYTVLLYVSPMSTNPMFLPGVYHPVQTAPPAYPMNTIAVEHGCLAIGGTVGCSLLQVIEPDVHRRVESS